MRLPRLLLPVVWLGLFLAGCMTQMDLITGPKPGTDDLAVTRFAKTKAHGTGQWQTNPDGTRQIGVALAPLRPDPVPGRFRTQDVAQSAITAIRAEITAPDLASPIFANNADPYGSIAVVNGAIGTLTFSSVPPGKHRTLTVTGYDSGGQPVPGARIRTLFDLAGSSGSFEVSPRTTPAADAFAGLHAANPLAAASVASADLAAFVDSIMGVSGSYPNYTFVTHPSLVDTDGLASALASNNGSTAGLSTSSFAMPGAQVQFSFYLPYDGSPTTADQPTVWIDDPATEPYLIPHHPASSGPVTLVTSPHLDVTIDNTNLVTVTYKKVPPGTWKAGASLSGDNTPAPNPRYFHTQATQGTYTAGHATVATVTKSDAQSSAAIAPTFAVPALDPKWVANKVRIRNDAQPEPAAVNIESGIASAALTIAASTSTDKTVYVGPTLSGAPPYDVGSFTLPAGQSVAITGPAGASVTDRPVIVGDQITLNAASQILANLHLSGVSVAITGTGGMLQHVTVEGIRGMSGLLAGVLATGGFASLDHVWVYDVRHTATSPTGGDKVAGIAFTDSAEGVIRHCVVDDQAGAGDTKSVRFAGPGGLEAMGIKADTSGNVVIEDSQAIRIGYTGGSNQTYMVTGIAATGSGHHVVSGCTVSSLAADSTLTGISLTNGTVAGCDVHHLSATPGHSMAIMGIQVGYGSPVTAVTASGNRIHHLEGTESGVFIRGLEVWPAASGSTTTVSGNTVADCQGRSLVGIALQGNGSGSAPTSVSGNVIEGNSSVDAADAEFRGISATEGYDPQQLTLSGNQIRSNVAYANGWGISVYVEEGEMLVTGNQVSNNEFRHDSGSNYFNGRGIDVYLPAFQDCVVEDNVVSGNEVVLGNSGSFYGITAGGGAIIVLSNQIYGNTVTAAPTNYMDYVDVAMITSSAQYFNILANRIYGNTFTIGGNANDAHVRMIQASLEGEVGIIEGNLIATSNFGTAENHFAIEAQPANFSGIAVVANSIYQSHCTSALIRGTGPGRLQVMDNVLATGNAATGSHAVGVLSGAELQSLGYNTAYPWTVDDLFDNGQPPDPQNPIADPSDRQAGNFPFQDTQSLQLITSEAPPAVTGSEGAGHQRGAYGFTLPSQ